MDIRSPRCGPVQSTCSSTSLWWLPAPPWRPQPCCPSLRAPGMLCRPWPQPLTPLLRPPLPGLCPYLLCTLTKLFCTAFIALQCVALQCVALHCIALCCIALQWLIWHCVVLICDLIHFISVMSLAGKACKTKVQVVLFARHPSMCCQAIVHQVRFFVVMQTLGWHPQCFVLCLNSSAGRLS